MISLWDLEAQPMDFEKTRQEELLSIYDTCAHISLTFFGTVSYIYLSCIFLRHDLVAQLRRDPSLERYKYALLLWKVEASHVMLMREQLTVV